MDENKSQDSLIPAPDVTTIGLDTLLPVVRRAHGDSKAVIQNWKCDPLSGGIGGGAIYRFSGMGVISGNNKNWSVILKVIKYTERNTAHGIHPNDWNYYKREADAYRSGWLNELPDGISAPRPFGIVDYPDDTCWLWLEDIQGIKNQWTMQDYEQVARNIGKFNGAFLSNEAIPQQPWMSSNWIREYVNSSSEGMKILSNSLDHPLAKRWYPANTSEKIFQLWQQREVYFKAMDQLPQTICHLDFFRRNMFLSENSDAHSDATAIDWAFAGFGCVGADINPLVIVSLAFFDVPLGQAKELDQIVFNGYLDGLQQTGWRGDPRQVRLGYLISNMRYLLNEVGDWMGAIFDENKRGAIEEAFGHPLGEIFDYFVALRSTISFLDDERDKLMDELNYW